MSAPPRQTAAPARSSVLCGRIDPGMAEHLYGRRVDGMAKSYALSGVPAARLYRSWQRANRAPYRSATHGDRYVNNYVNGIAAERYGRLAEGEAMPVGSIIAKDAIDLHLPALLEGVFGSRRRLLARAEEPVAEQPRRNAPGGGDLDRLAAITNAYT